MGKHPLKKNTIEGWFKTIFSIVFYLGLFAGIGYLIQLTFLQ